MDHFELVSEYEPTGDQPQAIEKLTKGFQDGNQFETLLGVTGSGKTFTMANIIQNLNKPTLILAHNKTLAAQLYSEFKAFFPHNAVEYFVSYYDYYQPEAYVPSTDTYIEKDSSVNDEIDKLRHSATAALIERKDVIVVSSVSCIYGIGSKESYSEMMISLRPGMIKDRDEVIDDLINIQYVRSELDFKRGTFRVKGDVLEILPVSTFEDAVRVEFFGDEIDRIVEFDVLTGEVKRSLNFVAIFPASHYVVPQEQIERAIKGIKEELAEQVTYFKEHDQLIEAQRIAERTNFDIEMLRETGFCSGIENYSRHLAGLEPGQPPSTLIDFFGDDFLMIIDESHITVPQIGGMYAGDQSRKSTLVDFGFRLPSAKDNRPLEFGEFEQKIDQMLFVSATPGKYEEEHELLRAEQIIRPTGLLDPAIDVRPVEGQIDDLLGEIHKETDKGNKVLVTTLTKRMAEELTDYMREVGIRVKYLHSDIGIRETIIILRRYDQRSGEAYHHPSRLHLGHAPGDDDLFSGRLELVHPLDHPLFRSVYHGAGVEDNYVCLVGGEDTDVAERIHTLGQFLPLSVVHRTAVRFYEVSHGTSVVHGLGGDLPEGGLRRDVGDLDVGPGASGGPRDDDQIVHVLPYSVTFLSDVVDGHFDDVSGAEGVGILGFGGLPDHYGSAGTACLADEDERPVLFLYMGVGPAALGADDIGLGVVLDLLVDVGRTDLGLEHDPAA